MEHFLGYKHIAWLRGQLEGTPVTEFRRLAIGPTFHTVSYNPYVFTATSSDAPLISETVGDDGYWSGIAQGDDEYLDVYDQVIMLVSIKCLSLSMKASFLLTIHALIAEQ
ncbi:hypothetical protein C5167_040536 [Papaver somniferum]|uniref:Uncharacterized protein n=1 Tax=Papaver somniferum TaxID=3469 RepID=A0A4Y7IIQ7_PAPSO|nr:hypothetical protein C5167_040536 [Papaver somniferum]